MSLRDEKIKSLLGTNLDDLSEEELKNFVIKFLQAKFMVFVLVFMKAPNNLEI